EPGRMPGAEWEGPGGRPAHPVLLVRCDCWLQPFGDALALREEQQVVRATGLGVGAAHVEAAEGLYADEGAGALAVEIEVAAVEVLGGALDALAVLREERAGEAELGVVGDLHGVVVVLRLDEGEDGAEDLLLRDGRLRVNIGDNGVGDEEAILFIALLPAEHQPRS